MIIRHQEIEQRLAGIVSSIGKNPESWQDWMCLHINLQNHYDDASFGRAIMRIHDFLSAYLKDMEVDVFSCRNKNVHVFSKFITRDVLIHAGQQICELLFDEEVLLATYETFDLEQDAFYYVSYALDQAAGACAIPVSAYSGLDPFVARSIQNASTRFHEKTILNHKDLTKVLLVEDDPVTRWMVRKGLKHDCQLMTSPTANQSFDKFNEFQPDIVFLDIDLPDKSGREVLHWIMRNDPGASVVMFSSNNDLENISGSLEEGASGFISKPFLREDLLHYIHAHTN
jgi:CheY-like chemotaxis protein